MSSHTNTRRVAKNTLMLYFRQILIMLVSLYTVRVVLSVLGVEDYGIFHVVAGVVTLFSFLSGSMASASQRYLSFELGRRDHERLKLVFSVTFKSYLLIAGIILLLAETVGLWFVHTQLNIPAERLTAAKVIYQFSIFSSLATVMTIPYMSAIIAHEEMKIYAYVSVLEAVLKLAVALVIPYILFDSLITYGFLVMLVVFINTAVYRQISKRKFEECRRRGGWDKGLFVEMLSFSGWNLLGTVEFLFRTQGINILINQFFAPHIVAARSISARINSAVSSVFVNFSHALKPQIIKSYAANERDEMTALIYRGSKLTFFLMYFVSLPLMVIMGDVLPIWLKNPPVYAVLFAQLTLIDTTINSISHPLMTLAQATGKIALYQSLVAGTLLLNLPIAYLFYRAGYPPETAFWISIALSLIAFVVRLLILNRIANFSIRHFISQVVIPVLLYAAPVGVVTVLLGDQFTTGFTRLFVLPLCSIALSCLCAFVFLLKREEKRLVVSKFLRFAKIDS